METYLFSNEAIGSMLVESYRDRSASETGGILLGPKNKRIVTDIIPSTIYAEKQVYSFFQTEQDIQILNQQLREFQAIGWDFNGYWHSHPNGLTELSFGDRNTCKKILKSPNYPINNQLLMCIVTEGHNNFPIYPYVVSLNKDEELEIREVSIKILPMRCIEECLECFVATPAIEENPKETDKPQVNHELQENNTQKGEIDESTNSGQDSEETEKPKKRRLFRLPRRKNNNSKLSEKKNKPKKSRNVLSRKGKSKSKAS